MFKVTFGVPDDFREPVIIDAEEFIAVKSFKAKGKRLTNFALGSVEELEPKPGAVETDDDIEETQDAEVVDIHDEVDEDKSDDEVRDEITGQQRIF